MIRRGAAELLTEARADTRVVLVQGPRQCGKTTLVREAAGDLPYATLDDGLAWDLAARNPRSFLEGYPDGAVIDEVQRAPGLFSALKARVDRDPRPGRWVLTGSSNVLLLPRLSDSLAGRMEPISLWPLAEVEVDGRLPGTFLDRCLRGDWAGLGSPEWTVDRIQLGGFPEARGRARHDRRHAWFQSYLTTLVERDVRDLASLDHASSIPRLLKALASCAGDTLNASALSRETGLPHSTLTRYLQLLEAVFLVRMLPAWQSGLGPRAIKSARVAFVDSGLLGHLLGRGEDAPPNLAQVWNAVTAEIWKQASWRPGPRLEVGHFRSVRRYEAPLVFWTPEGRVYGFSFTLESAAGTEQVRPLEFLKEVAGDRFLGGAVLHLGTEVQPAGEGLWGVPVSAVFG